MRQYLVHLPDLSSAAQRHEQAHLERPSEATDDLGGMVDRAISKVLGDRDAQAADAKHRAQHDGCRCERRSNTERLAPEVTGAEKHQERPANGEAEHERVQHERGRERDQRRGLHDAAGRHQPRVHDRRVPQHVAAVHADGLGAPGADAGAVCISVLR